MFDFIRKPFLWGAWEKGLDRQIGKTGQFHLKSIQDLAVYAHLKDIRGAVIAEIGGGDSRLLTKLAAHNKCVNVEKFEGADGGPKKEIVIDRVRNIRAFLGEQSPLLEENYFDVVFSVSVVEHVPAAALTAFFEDGLRILKPGGLWLHAIDMYLEDEPAAPTVARYNAYRNWLSDPRLAPVGPINDQPPRFTCDLATNPDDVMFSWGKIAPSLIDLRQRAQSVSLLVAGRKRP